MVRRIFFLVSTIAIVAIAAASSVWPRVWWSMAVIGPLVLLGLRDSMQSRHALLRNYPIIGWARFAAEYIRPEIQQYFVESDTSGTPFDRETRAVIYQRAKDDHDKVPFGTRDGSPARQRQSRYG